MAELGGRYLANAVRKVGAFSTQNCGDGEEMTLEETAACLERAKERRRCLGFINMSALSLDEKEELAIRCAKIDREIVLLQCELTKEINK